MAATRRALALLTLLAALGAANMTRAYADKPMDATGDQSKCRRGDQHGHLVCTQYLSPAVRRRLGPLSTTWQACTCSTTPPFHPCTVQAARATEQQHPDGEPAEKGLAAHVPPHLRHLASNFGVAQTPINAPVDFSVLFSQKPIHNWTYAQLMADPGGWLAQCSCWRACTLGIAQRPPAAPLPQTYLSSQWTESASLPCWEMIWPSLPSSGSIPQQCFGPACRRGCATASGRLAACGCWSLRGSGWR